MRAFEYANPSTVKQTLSLLGSNWDDAAVLAGGTDLLSLMKDNLVEPRRLVNVKGVHDLGGVAAVNGGLRIGAIATFTELVEHRQQLSEFPAILLAAEGVMSPQIRNMGTVGGDLLQRPRCWYFRNGFGLLARDSQGRSLVPNGDNRYHAIFGNSGPAYFVSPSSLAPPLVALGARVRLEGRKAGVKSRWPSCFAHRKTKTSGNTPSSRMRSSPRLSSPRARVACAALPTTFASASSWTGRWRPRRSRCGCKGSE